MNNEVKTCNVEGCSQPRYTKGISAVCIDHKRAAARAWNAANPEKKRAANDRYFAKATGKTYQDTSGYVFYVGNDHPACSPGGITKFHRIILWNKLDGQNVPCAECGEMVFWNVPVTDPNFLVVDHINEVRNDNRPENLEPVHSGCNTKRARINAAKRAAEADAE